MKHIVCAFIGTSLSLAIAGVVVLKWVEQEKRELRMTVDQTIDRVISAPGNAVGDLFESIGF